MGPSTPTPEEQLTLEYINQLRTDPGGEYDRLTDPAVYSSIAGAISFFGTSLAALEAQLNALSAAPPLAWNSNLTAAALGHNQAMIAGDEQSHQLPGEPALPQRVEAAGYTGWSSLGENIYAFADNPFHGHAGFVIDWGFDAEDFDSNGNRFSDWQTRGDGIQDPAGHRNSLMSTVFTEIGISIVHETNAATDVGELVITHDLGSRFSYQAQFLGVIINDTDNDDFYDIGEGLGGVTVTLTGTTATFQTTSWSSGGWQITVPAGSYTITFSGPGLSGSVVRNATLGSQNVKIDIEAADANGGATNGDDSLIGDAGDNVIDGLDGNDTIEGLTGNDSLYGGAGDDLLSGSGGEDFIDAKLGNDTVFGGSRTDVLFGGSGNDILNGASGNDRANGGSGADILYGGRDNDLLVGGPGNDVIHGGPGNDAMIGGSGNDRFVFEAGSGNDSITGFAAGAGTSESLDFSALNIAFGNLTIAQQGSDTLITTPGGDTVLLLNVNALSLSANEDFVF